MTVETKMDQFQRVEWIDVFKGIMIVLVVIGHATGRFNSWIYQFHMFAFFFISGYLANPEKKKLIYTAINKSLSLILPFFFLGIVGILANSMLKNIGIYEFLFGNSYLKFPVALREMFLNGNIYVQYCGTFWFLPALLGVEIFHQVLCRLNNKRINVLYFLLSAMFYFCGYYMALNILNPKIWIFDLTIIFIAQFYFCIGLLAKRYLTEDVLPEKPGQYSFCILLLGIVIIWGKENAVVVDLASRQVKNPVAELIVALASISLIVFLSTILERYSRTLKKIFVYFGSNSLGIMAFHFAFFKIFFCTLYKAGILDAKEISNVVIPFLPGKYWIGMTCFSILGSVLLWTFLVRIPYVQFFLGVRGDLNKKIGSRIDTNHFVKIITKKIFKACCIVKNVFYTCLSINKYYMILGIILIALTMIPIYKSGIINYGELQDRILALRGLNFYFKTKILEYVRAGRILVAPLASLFSYMGLIGVQVGNAFKIFQVIVLTLIVMSYGIFLYRLFKNIEMAIISAVVALACMPISFECVPPNMYVCSTGVPFIILFLSLIFFSLYMENHKKRDIFVSMFLLLVAQMCHETFTIYVFLYFMIAIGKKGIKGLKKNRELFFAPFFTTILYLACYIFIKTLFSSEYSHNWMKLENIGNFIKISPNMLISSIPGFYIFSKKYQNLRRLYDSLVFADYFRIVITVVLFGLLCALLFGNMINKEKTFQKFGKQYRINHLYIIGCGLLYILLPVIPIWLFGQSNGKEDLVSCMELSNSFFSYFAAVFILVYILICLCKSAGRKFYLIVVFALCVLTMNIQQMNDIFSKEQNQNFSRLLNIEHFLKTDTAKKFQTGTYEAEDLYKYNNELEIQDDYWTSYCNNIVGINLILSNGKDENQIGYISYDDEDIAVIDAEEIKVFSINRKIGTKAIKVDEGKYTSFEFQNETYDNGFYVYSQRNVVNESIENSLIPLEGYSTDGWLEKNSKWRIVTGELGRITIKLYYPGDDYAGKTINVFIGDSVFNLTFEDSFLEREIHVKPNSNFEMRISCNFEFLDKGNDIRELAVVLNDIIIE